MSLQLKIFLFIVSGFLLLGVAWLLIQNHRELDSLRELIELSQKEPQDNKVNPIQNATSNPTNKHAVEISKIEKESGIRLSVLVDLITREEGTRFRPYLDSENAPTIGVGRNLSGNGLSVKELHAIADEIDYQLLLREAHVEHSRIRIPTLALANKVFKNPITKDDVKLLLHDDLNNTRHEAISVFGEQLWNEISEPRKLALIDMIFNLGLTRFREFVKFINDVKNKNWREASVEVLLSAAARENIKRYHRISLVIDQNSLSAFNLR